MSTGLEAARIARVSPSWQVKKIRHIARLIGGGTPPKDSLAFWENGTIPWVSPKDVKSRIINATEDYITEDAVDASATSFVEANSPLMVVRSGILRHTLPIALAGCRVTLNQDMKAFKLASEVDPSFFAWWVEGQGSDLLLEWRQLGATVESIDTRCLMNSLIAIPELRQQKAIARYLDAEIAAIDVLVARKKQFLRTIEEKRQALTASLVDGSLIHGASSAGSAGWFGTLPAHWEVRRARFLFRERIDLSQDGSEELLTVSHITGVTARSTKDVNMFLAESLEGYKLVQPHDLVVNTMWAWMGAIGVCTLAGCASPSYAVYRPRSEIFHSDYLDLVVRSLPFVAEVNRRSKGVWASRLRLYPDAFMDIYFPLPPLAEQRELVEALQRSLAREEKIADNCRRSIELLKERRSALITSAVSGQIDVQNDNAHGMANAAQTEELPS